MISIQSKILLTLLLIATSHLHSMDDSTAERSRRDVEYAYIPNHGLLFTFAETVRNDLLKKGIVNVPESDYEDAQKIILWIGAHFHETSANHGLPYVPKETLRKILDRLYELKILYSSNSPLYPKEHFIGDAQANPEGLKGYFHQEIYFSPYRGPRGSYNFTNQLSKLVENRLVMAGAGVIAAAAAWYWFYYLSEPNVKESDIDDITNQSETLEDTK